MSHWVYIVRCADSTLYTGMSTDVDRRAAEHSAGTGAKYTRGRGPVEVVYREECVDLSAALRREAAIKRLSRAEKLELVERSVDGAGEADAHGDEPHDTENRTEGTRS